jgi:predicted DCC family thiol-disulfide oxidoreductase YuxK
MKPRGDQYPLTLLYDGACPFCRLEMEQLARRDALERLVFVDITAPDFDLDWFAGDSGVTLQDLNRLIHAVRPDGTLVAGVEVFRLAYGAVGLGPLWAATALPLIKPLVDRGYAAFARNRYAISALFAPLLVRVQAARAARRSKACAEGVCETHPEIFR